MKTDYVFKTEPWEHQRLALDFLMQRDISALYTDMGTGKSKIIIDYIVNRGFETVLIVCTNKGCEVWEKQFSIHSYLPPQNVLNLSGVPTKEKLQLVNKKLSERKSGILTGTLVLLINYEGIWRKQFANYLMRKTVPIDAVICDESHRIKSPGSKCSMFLARLGKKVKVRTLVTGTPLAENPMDVYAQYKFLDPTIFGTSFSNFKDQYQNVDIRKSMKVGYTVLNASQPYKNLDDLKEKMFSVAFCMPSSVKLPKRTTITRHFRISEKASNVYKEMCDEGILTHGEWYCEAENALTAMIRKRQIASGFVSTVNDTLDKKIFKLDDTRSEVLKDLLLGLPKDEPVVVFAQYTYDLRRIKKAVTEIGRGYSELSGREDTEADWQAGKTSVLGVQFSKGSESADFTRACYTVYYTMTNRLALYEQSKKRIHRPGQTRPVKYYHLVAELADGKPCIDALVIQAVKNKRDIVQYVMEQEGRQ